jgi:hypothetical protein
MSESPVMNKAEKNEAFIATANADRSTGKVEARAGLAEIAIGKDDGMKTHGKILTAGAEG